MKKLILFVMFLVSFTAFSQVDLTRDKERLFRSFSTYPNEGLKTAEVVVIKSMYGLTFENKYLSENTKKTVKRFFKQSLNKYSSLKKYRLKLEKRIDGMYIDGVKILHQPL